MLLRHLLQKSTGFLTGSKYKDHNLMANNFPGEGVIDGSVLVVKSHLFNFDEMEIYNRMIVIMRDPLEAALAEFNRVHAGPTGVASEDHFNDGDWVRSAKAVARHWEEFHQTILKKYDGPTHLVKYSDLKSDPIGELKKCLDFLGLNIVLNEDILKCLKRDLEGSFHRKVKQNMTEIIQYLDDNFVADTEKMADEFFELFEETVALNKITNCP